MNKAQFDFNIEYLKDKRLDKDDFPAWAWLGISTVFTSVMGLALYTILAAEIKYASVETLVPKYFGIAASSIGTLLGFTGMASTRAVHKISKDYHVMETQESLVSLIPEANQDITVIHVKDKEGIENLLSDSFFSNGIGTYFDVNYNNAIATVSNINTSINETREKKKNEAYIYEVLAQYFDNSFHPTEKEKNGIMVFKETNKKRYGKNFLPNIADREAGKNVMGAYRFETPNGPEIVFFNNKNVFIKSTDHVYIKANKQIINSHLRQN